MAIIQNEISFSSAPPFATIIEATETGRNGTSVTFKITMKLKINRTTSKAFYGYAINWRTTLNGTSSGLLKVKDASPRWYGGEPYRTFTSTLTTSVGASGGSIPLKVEILASGGGNISFNKTYNVSYSTWNTPPSMSGSLGVSPSGIIGENTGSISLSWNKASDSNNNLSGYQIYRYVNGSHNATFDVGATATSYSDNISGFGQGTNIYYKIWAKDSYNEWSNALTSATVTKNTLRGATLSLSGSIGYNTKTISASFSGASNTNGNTTFKYKLYSDHIKVYNHDKITGTPFTITIVRSGETAPSTPYILFNDIKTFASGGSNWTRTATFMLETSNSYGSLAHSNGNISINLQTTPNAPTTVTLSGRTVLSDSRSYYICGKSTMSVAWSGASDPLGGSLKYDVQTKVGAGAFTTVKSNLTTTNTTISIPTVSAEESFYVRVVAKTTYGTSAYKDATMEKIHYYNTPTIEFKNVNRTAEGVSVDVVTQTNTSIPSVGWTKRAYSGLLSGNLTTSPQTLSKTGLDSGTAYTLTVAIQDNTGLSNEISKSCAIPVYTPILSVREKGVGVNAIPDGSAKLVVNGGAKITGGLTVDGKKITGDIDTSNLLKKSDLATATNYKGKVANIGNDGVMEVGKYIDFHNHTTNDYDSRITCDGDILTVSRHLATGGNLTVGGTIIPQSYISLPSNGGSWLNGATNGNIRGSKQSTGSYHPIISQTTSSGHKISLGGLGDDFGFHIYDKNRTENGIDKYWRFSLEGKDLYTNMRFTVQDNWLYTTGNTGWYNSTYGGGWYMTDSTWLRAYGNKSLYTGSGNIKTENTVICKAIDDVVGSANSCVVDNANGSNSQITLRPDVDNKGNLGHRNFTWNYANISAIGSTYSIERDGVPLLYTDYDAMYNMVKDMNLYTIKDFSYGDDGELQRSYRTRLVANAKELPYEVAPENHMQNGDKSIDIGGMICGLSGALKVAIEKIEQLEDRISELEGRL